MSDPEIPERRFDYASLADMAGLSTSIACECPQHLADILSRLGRFEAYSADCRQLIAVFRYHAASTMAIAVIAAGPGTSARDPNATGRDGFNA